MAELSVPCVYVLSGIAGALAAINLGSLSPACCATAAVAGLLGEIALLDMSLEQCHLSLC